jgi:hypothetical protein
LQTHIVCGFLPEKRHLKHCSAITPRLLIWPHRPQIWRPPSRTNMHWANVRCVHEVYASRTRLSMLIRVRILLMEIYFGGL